MEIIKLSSTEDKPSVEMDPIFVDISNIQKKLTGDLQIRETAVNNNDDDEKNSIVQDPKLVQCGVCFREFR
jgi:hypothetical protein